MSKIAKGVGIAALALVGVVGAGAAWVEMTSSSMAAQVYETHRVDIPFPFPLTEGELAALRAEKAAELAAATPTPPPDAALVGSAGGGPVAADGTAADGSTTAEPPPDPLAGVDLDAIAMERAVARGEHLVLSRYACVECHGDDFAGGVMVDDPAIGSMLGRNLTTGKGGVTAGYTMADWDRIVRHGVKPDGTGAVMPSEDYVAMSDRELSDIVAYIRSKPAQDAEVPPPALGPLGKVLIATNQFKMSASLLPDHQAAHAVEPPEAAANVEFGKHLAQICTGCHNPELSGGPMAGAPPDWAVPRNLTPHEDGLKGWTFENFETAMRQGKRPDGSALGVPMNNMPKYAQRMTDTEMQALWMYIQQLPATPTPQG